MYDSFCGYIIHVSLLQDLPGIPIFKENICFKATVKARTYILNG